MIGYLTERVRVESFFLPIVLVSVDRAAGIPRVAQYAVDSLSAPRFVVENRLRYQTVRFTALVELVNDYGVCPDKPGHRLRDVWALFTGQRGGKSGGRRTFLDGEEPVDFTDRGYLVFDHVTVGQVTEKALALGRPTLPGTLKLALGLRFDCVASHHRVHVGGPPTHRLLAVDVQSFDEGQKGLLRGPDHLHPIGPVTLQPGPILREDDVDVARLDITQQALKLRM